MAKHAQVRLCSIENGDARLALQRVEKLTKVGVRSLGFSAGIKYLVQKTFLADSF
jgi:hypothetical protein